MEPHLLYLVAVLGLGIAAQWLAWRLRLPAVLLLLLFGFAAGQIAFRYAANWCSPSCVEEGDAS